MSVSRLDELIGLDSAKRVLRGLGATDSGAHAILLYGGEGSGKTTLAKMLALNWLCLAPTADGACGSCRVCESFGRGNCGDLLVVEPQPPSNLIKLNQIHPVKQPGDPPHLPIQIFLRTSPMAAKCKVVLIESADRMNGEAANALLKTLEEPNEFAKLVLTTQHVSRVLPTILSRCLAVACPSPEDESLRALLPDLTDEELRFADGSVGEAVRFKRHEEVFGKLLTFAGSLPKRPAAEALVAADEFRAICEELGDAEGCPARQAQAEALKLLTRCIMKARPAKFDWAQATIEAHRRIVGNAGVGATFDALFTRLLLNR